ncbi:MAG: NACHT domain-containing protein, partial [Chloroflexota bacterium]
MEEMPMEPISYFNMLLADPRITMLQIPDMQRPLEVARVYVQLRISEERQQGYDTPVIDEESTETTEDDPNVWIEEERQRRERHVEVIYDPEKAIHTFPRCVIMGGPGVGKTTLLRHLAIMAAQRSIAGMPSLLPVYVELQSFVRSGQHDLLDFVSATWEGAYAFPAQQARLLLANYLEEGKALLLLDALDETVVGETPEAAQQSYEAVSQAILALVADYPKASMVATIRKASYRQHKPLVGFTALEVMDFRFEDVKQFVRNWYDAAHDLQAEEKSADLIKRLDANSRLQTMATDPLL